MLSASFAMRRRDNNADAFGFIRHLIDLNRSSGNVTENKWLVAFSEVVGDETTCDIKMFIDDGVPDDHFLAEAFFRNGRPLPAGWCNIEDRKSIASVDIMVTKIARSKPRGKSLI